MTPILDDAMVVVKEASPSGKLLFGNHKILKTLILVLIAFVFIN